MSKKQVAAARVRVTPKGREKLDPCSSARKLWLRMYRNKNMPVTEKNIRLFTKYDVMRWVGGIYETMLITERNEHSSSTDLYGDLGNMVFQLEEITDKRFHMTSEDSINGVDPNFSDAQIEDITAYTKAAIIVAKRYYSAQR